MAIAEQSMTATGMETEQFIVGTTVHINPRTRWWTAPWAEMEIRCVRDSKGVVGFCPPPVRSLGSGNNRIIIQRVHTVVSPNALTQRHRVARSVRDLADFAAFPAEGSVNHRTAVRKPVTGLMLV